MKIRNFQKHQKAQKKLDFSQTENKLTENSINNNINNNNINNNNNFFSATNKKSNIITFNTNLKKKNEDVKISSFDEHIPLSAKNKNNNNFNNTLYKNRIQSANINNYNSKNNNNYNNTNYNIKKPAVVNLEFGLGKSNNLSENLNHLLANATEEKIFYNTKSFNNFNKDNKFHSNYRLNNVNLTANFPDLNNTKSNSKRSSIECKNSKRK